jgi:putative ABC transport system permease protein
VRKWYEPLASAWSGVATRKLRSLLTILGVVIGVASVIVLMSVGSGAQATIVSNIESMGSNMLFVRGGMTVSFQGVRGYAMSSSGGNNTATLTLEDGEAIAAGVPHVAAVAPSSTSNQQVIAGDENTNASVVGITTDYQTAYNLTVAQGSFISQYQYDNSQYVAVIGSGVAGTLFPGTDPLGQQMRLGDTIVRVVGVLESKGQSMSGSPDDSILIPLTTMQNSISNSRNSSGDHGVSSLAVAIADSDYSSAVSDGITALLRTRHNLAATASDDFTVTSVQELADTISSTVGQLTILLGAIAGISLFVGGIGVMNIMLVSVMERRREIGIRKALGARESQIWRQFLIEAALLTFSGGIIGVALGWGLSSLITRMGLMTTLVSPNTVIMAVGVAVGIGLFFGFYPALQASKLNPVEALRSE